MLLPVFFCSDSHVCGQSWRVGRWLEHAAVGGRGSEMEGPGDFSYCFTANGGGGGYLPLACVPHVDRCRPASVMTAVDCGPRRSLCGLVTVQGARLQTSDYSKEMDDLVTGQSPSAHLFPGEEAEPRPCFWMHVASRRQSTGALGQVQQVTGRQMERKVLGAGGVWSRFHL